MMSKPWRSFSSALVALAVVTAGSGQAFADFVAFGVDTGENLYSINLGTAAATLIGNTGAFLEGVAITSDGSLYGTDAGGNLYSISTSTGAATLIGNTGLGNIEGLDFSGSTLLGTDFNNPTTIYSISLSTAAATPLVTTAPTEGPTRAFAVESANTGLIVTDTPSFQTLHAVDLTTGATTTRGALVSPSGIYGIDFAGSVLYGLGGNGDLDIIDASNGSILEVVGNTGGQFWLDLTIGSAVATIPEPSTLLVAGSVILLAGLIRLRRGGEPGNA